LLLRAELRSSFRVTPFAALKEGASTLWGYDVKKTDLPLPNPLTQVGWKFKEPRSCGRGVSAGVGKSHLKDRVGVARFPKKKGKPLTEMGKTSRKKCQVFRWGSSHANEEIIFLSGKGEGPTPQSFKVR